MLIPCLIPANKTDIVSEVPLNILSVLSLISIISPFADANMLEKPSAACFALSFDTCGNVSKADLNANSTSSISFCVASLIYFKAVAVSVFIFDQASLVLACILAPPSLNISSISHILPDTNATNALPAVLNIIHRFPKVSCTTPPINSHTLATASPNAPHLSINQLIAFSFVPIAVTKPANAATAAPINTGVLTPIVDANIPNLLVPVAAVAAASANFPLKSTKDLIPEPRPVHKPPIP